MRVTGICIVKLNGRALQSKEGAKLMYGGFERTAIYADGKFIGHAWKPMSARITCTLAHVASTDMDELAYGSDFTLQFTTDTGVTYVVRDAAAVSPPELTGGEGDLEIEFEGHPAEAL